LADESGSFLLEVEHRTGQWSKVAAGSIKKLIASVARDAGGKFHCLGSLERSLRQAAQAGLARLPTKQVGPVEFAFVEAGKVRSVQECLFHHFGVPIHVIARPAGWYSYHRRPRIVECSESGTRVLVRFTALSWSGEEFGGTCLYAKRDERWNCYTIRPRESRDIATAEAWLVKRNWQAWS
jgi:hypothetical protein